MFEIGQRVRHRRFGTGTLKQVHTQQETPTGLIEWDTHRVGHSSSLPTVEWSQRSILLSLPAKLGPRAAIASEEAGTRVTIRYSGSVRMSVFWDHRRVPCVGRGRRG